MLPQEWLCLCSAEYQMAWLFIQMISSRLQPLKIKSWLRV